MECDGIKILVKEPILLKQGKRCNQGLIHYPINVQLETRIASSTRGHDQGLFKGRISAGSQLKKRMSANIDTHQVDGNTASLSRLGSAG